MDEETAEASATEGIWAASSPQLSQTGQSVDARPTRQLIKRLIGGASQGSADTAFDKTNALIQRGPHLLIEVFAGQHSLFIRS